MREYQVVALNRRAGAPTVEQVIARPNIAKSRPPEQAGAQIGQGKMFLEQLDQQPDLVVDSLFEIWEGWRNPANDEWDSDYEVYGYFVQEHAGQFAAGGTNHQFDIDTADYNILFDTTPVVTWPTDLEMGDPAAGYPPGYSVQDWFVGLASGGKPYDGIIPFHFPGGKVDFGYINPVFDAIILDAGHMPTMSNVDKQEEFGMFGFLGLRELMDEVIKYARLAAADSGWDVQPAYFMRAVVKPSDHTKICPQFCLVDLNNEQDQALITPVCTYTTETPDPASGIYPIEFPFRHQRDARSVRTEIILMADGDRADGFVWSAKHSTTGADRYPAYYHRRGYWGGPPVLNSNIQEQDDCDALAQRIVDIIWGPRGQITFQARAPRKLKVGDFIVLNVPAEGQDNHILPVQKITRAQDPGSTLMTVTVGERDIAIGDILLPKSDTPMLSTQSGGAAQQGTVAGQFAGGGGRSGTPRQRPLTNVATTPRSNVVQGQNNSIPTLDLRQNPSAAPSVLDSIPDPSDISRLASTWDSDDLAWIKRVWTDKYGTPHKQKLCTFFESNRTNWLSIVERMTIREEGIPTAETGLGISFTYVVMATGGGLTTVTIPFEVLPGEELAITCSGLTGGHVSLTLVTGDPL